MIAFTVDGVPATKGSYRAFTYKRKTGGVGARVDNDNPKCKAWQTAIGWKAKIAMRAWWREGRVHHVGSADLSEPLTCDARVSAVFRFPRPKKTKFSRPRQDIDKLLRALFDGMSGIVVDDDARFVLGPCDKRWCEAGELPGVSVTVEPCDDGRPAVAIVVSEEG